MVDGHAFRNEHAYFFSLFKFDITYKDRNYHSPEQAIHHVRADENNQPVLASQILVAKTSRHAMHSGKKVKTSEVYRQTEPNLLQNIHKAKFDQHPNLRAKLIKLKSNMYEATHHPLYGAGYSLAQ